MNCPHCGHDKSRITDTEARDDSILRYRMCRGCGRTYATIERIAVNAGRGLGYVEAPSSFDREAAAPIAEAPAPPRNRRPPRFAPNVNAPQIQYLPVPIRELLVQWWNESRWSKHGSKATWTQAAWTQSVNRLLNLSEGQQLELAQAGVEHGWQALKVSYLDKPAAPSPVSPQTASGRPRPRDPAMVAALDQWPS